MFFITFIFIIFSNCYHINFIVVVLLFGRKSFFLHCSCSQIILWSGKLLFYILNFIVLLFVFLIILIFGFNVILCWVDEFALNLHQRELNKVPIANEVGSSSIVTCSSVIFSHCWLAVVLPIRLVASFTVNLVSSMTVISRIVFQIDARF